MKVRRWTMCAIAGLVILAGAGCKGSEEDYRCVCQPSGTVYTITKVDSQAKAQDHCNSIAIPPDTVCTITGKIGASSPVAPGPAR